MVPHVIPCKVCGADSPLHGAVDFNKSCEMRRGIFLPLRGWPIWYHRCSACGFLFTAQFDDWSPEDWRREVYNAAYGEVDPDYADGSRARANVALVLDIGRKLGVRGVMDYGGGDGKLGEALSGHGFELVASCDPNFGAALPSGGNFDLVTAFEVFEHTTTPFATLKEAMSFLRPGGALLFSTLICDALPQQSCDWWYLAPRNGHVSIHTTASLDRLFANVGWSVRHLSAAFHLAVDKPAR